MRYLVTSTEFEPFLTKWFDPDNNFVLGMVVYDLYNFTYTKDGTTWIPLAIEHL